MPTDPREDQYRENVPVPEPAENNTPLPEPDALPASDTVDTDPNDQGGSPTPSTDS